MCISFIRQCSRVNFFSETFALSIIPKLNNSQLMKLGSVCHCCNGSLSPVPWNLLKSSSQQYFTLSGCSRCAEFEENGQNMPSSIIKSFPWKLRVSREKYCLCWMFDLSRFHRRHCSNCSIFKQTVTRSEKSQTTVSLQINFQCQRSNHLSASWNNCKPEMKPNLANKLVQRTLFHLY